MCIRDSIIVSRVGQIMPHGEFYTFESKYEDAESKTCIPAKVDEEIQEQIRKYAVRAFKAIEMCIRDRFLSFIVSRSIIVPYFVDSFSAFKFCNHFFQYNACKNVYQ